MILTVAMSLAVLDEQAPNTTQNWRRTYLFDQEAKAITE